MIWFLLILTALSVMLYLFAPLFADKSMVKLRPILGLIALLSVGAIVGTYNAVGRPDLAGTQTVQTPPEAASRDTGAQSGEALVAQLKNRLIGTNSQDPKGWQLLARSQMQMGQFDEALQSYDVLLKITDNEPAILAEAEQARAFAGRQAAAAQMQSLPEEEQQAMIKSMVDGLAARIYANGGTAEEWMRLLRARKVLGQDELLADDIALMKKQFEEKPDIIKQILASE